MRKINDKKARELYGGAIPWGPIIEAAASVIPVVIDFIKGLFK